MVLLCWLWMMALHEVGHVAATLLLGGEVERVIWHPLEISATFRRGSASPVLDTWAGPLAGVVLPLALWGLGGCFWRPAAAYLRFFAGFCLIANGAYMAAGASAGVGDGGDLLRLGAAAWPIYLFGLVATVGGLALWHGQGRHFGLEPDSPPIGSRRTLVVVALSLATVVAGFALNLR
jgi:hypothetical protein